MYCDTVLYVGDVALGTWIQWVLRPVVGGSALPPRLCPVGGSAPIPPGFSAGCGFLRAEGAATGGVRLR